MNVKSDLSRGVALIQAALNHVANHSDRGSTDAAIDTAQELLVLIDDLPQSVMDSCSPEQCQQCHYWQRTVDLEPYGDRHVTRDTYECMANSFSDCPAVRRAGLGPDDLIEIPDFMKRQAI